MENTKKPWHVATTNEKETKGCCLKQIITNYILETPKGTQLGYVSTHAKQSGTNNEWKYTKFLSIKPVEINYCGIVDEDGKYIGYAEYVNEYIGKQAVPSYTYYKKDLPEEYYKIDGNTSSILNGDEIRKKIEAEEKAKKEAEEKAKKEAEKQAKKEAEEKAKNEAEEKAKKEAEAQEAGKFAEFKVGGGTVKVIEENEQLSADFSNVSPEKIQYIIIANVRKDDNTNKFSYVYEYIFGNANPRWILIENDDNSRYSLSYNSEKFVNQIEIKNPDAFESGKLYKVERIKGSGSERIDLYVVKKERAQLPLPGVNENPRPPMPKSKPPKPTTPPPKDKPNLGKKATIQPPKNPPKLKKPTNQTVGTEAILPQNQTGVKTIPRPPAQLPVVKTIPRPPAKLPGVKKNPRPPMPLPKGYVWEEKLDKNSESIRKEFYILKEKAIKTGLKYIEEPKSFNINNNINGIYNAFEDMRRGLLANGNYTSEKDSENAKKYLIDKNKFGDKIPQNTDYNLLKEEIKEISKILKNYKYEKPRKSNKGESSELFNYLEDVLEKLYPKKGKEYAKLYRSVEKKYFDIKKEANNKLFDGNYNEEENQNGELVKKINGMINGTEKVAGFVGFVLRLAFNIKYLKENITNLKAVNSKAVDSEAVYKEAYNEVDGVFYENENNGFKKCCLELEKELDEVKKLIKKSDNKQSKNGKKDEKSAKKLSDAQIIVNLKKLYSFQKKLAEKQGAKEIYELNNFNINNEGCVNNIYFAFQTLKKAIISARIKKLSEEQFRLLKMKGKLSDNDKNEQERLETLKRKVVMEEVKLDKKLNNIDKEEYDPNVKADGEVPYEEKIKLLEYAQKTKAELMRLISDDTTELKDTQDKKIKSGGKGLGEKFKESVGEFFGGLFGKKVELSLDNGLVADFKKISSSIKNFSTSTSLKQMLQTAFSDRKKIYESWYEYIYSSAVEFEKFFANKKVQMDSNNASIVLMYIFLRSLVHAKLKDVNSVRKGLKTFVKEVLGSKSKKSGNVNENKNDVEVEGNSVGNVKDAGEIVLGICQTLKNNIFNILNRKKDMKKVVKKSDCLKILEFVIVDSNDDNKKKKFRKDLQSKFK